MVKNACKHTITSWIDWEQHLWLKQFEFKLKKTALKISHVIKSVQSLSEKFCYTHFLLSQKDTLAENHPLSSLLFYSFNHSAKTLSFHMRPWILHPVVSSLLQIKFFEL